MSGVATGKGSAHLFLFLSPWNATYAEGLPLGEGSVSGAENVIQGQSLSLRVTDEELTSQQPYLQVDD